MPNIIATVFSYIEREALWPAHARLVVAVSGGADSLCLLGLLLDLREANHPLAPDALIVAHLDHGLRGAAGADDAAWVGELAAALKLPFFTERADVGAFARTAHLSSEDAARTARYTFLRRVAAQVDAHCICTGHTADDQVETILMHWLRGSGLRGLSGMSAQSGDLARPLLAITHDETLAYCTERGWTPRHDETNDELAYQRNRVRHELLPLLERYNSHLRQTWLRNAAIIAEDEHYLEQETERAYAGVCISQHDEVIMLNLPALLALPLALQRRVIRHAGQQVASDPQVAQLEAKHLFQIEHLVTQGHSGARLNLPGKVTAERGYETLIICQVSASRKPPKHTNEVPLPVPGECDLPELGWHLSTMIQDASAANMPSSALEKDRAPRKAPKITAADYPIEMTAYFDADIAGSDLIVRTWRPGDRFCPLGMQQEKKLQDYLTDAKVPRDLRQSIPLVFNSQHLIWVAGLRLDDRVKVTTQTQRLLVIQIKPLSH